MPGAPPARRRASGSEDEERLSSPSRTRRTPPLSPRRGETLRCSPGLSTGGRSKEKTRTKTRKGRSSTAPRCSLRLLRRRCGGGRGLRRQRRRRRRRRRELPPLSLFPRLLSLPLPPTRRSSAPRTSSPPTSRAAARRSRPWPSGGRRLGGSPRCAFCCPCRGKEEEEEGEEERRSSSPPRPFTSAPRSRR